MRDWAGGNEDLDNRWRKTALDPKSCVMARIGWAFDSCPAVLIGDEGGERALLERVARKLPTHLVPTTIWHGRQLSQLILPLLRRLTVQYNRPELAAWLPSPDRIIDLETPDPAETPGAIVDRTYLRWQAGVTWPTDAECLRELAEDRAWILPGFDRPAEAS